MIVFIITFCLFTAEALFHYNYGKNGDKKKEQNFHLPTKEMMLQIVLTVAFFSLLNSYILKYLAQHYNIHGDF